MSGMYPILWAMKHAPCADVYEQAVLIQMADSADEDGCNAYLAKETIADRIAGDIDPETVRRKWRSMERRGLIRPDTSPEPPRYRKIPKNRRPKRWELCIPFSWWSDAQREQVQRGREDRGLRPLSPESRPDLSAPPPKKARSDKGRKRGNSQSPGKSWGHSEWPQEDGSGTTDSGPQGPLTVVPRGHSQWSNPPLDHPHVPSSPPQPSPPDGAVQGPGGEEENPKEETTDPVADERLRRAEAIVGDAVRRWPQRHRAPGPRDRQRLTERVAAELEAGGDEDLILSELTRDMREAADAVKVVMGARTRTPGWGRSTDPRPEPLRHKPDAPRPAWCGVCDEATRLLAGITSDGKQVVYRCARCHPDPDTTAWDGPDGPESDAEGPEDTGTEPEPEGLDSGILERMRASLQQASGNGRTDGGDRRAGDAPTAAGDLFGQVMDEMVRGAEPGSGGAAPCRGRRAPTMQ